MEEGRKNAALMLEKAKEESSLEREEARKGLQKEVSGLVKASVRKILEHIADESTEKALWDKAVKELKKHEG